MQYILFENEAPYEDTPIYEIVDKSMIRHAYIEKTEDTVVCTEYVGWGNRLHKIRERFGSQHQAKERLFFLYGTLNNYKKEERI
jgi:hypothetical protein